MPQQFPNSNETMITALSAFVTGAKDHLWTRPSDGAMTAQARLQLNALKAEASKLILAITEAASDPAAWATLSEGTGFDSPLAVQVRSRASEPVTTKASKRNADPSDVDAAYTWFLKVTKAAMYLSYEPPSVS